MELSLMQKFADPTLFDQLSNGDKAVAALITTIMGMGITFIVLILLWAMIAIMTKILDSLQKKPETVNLTSAQAVAEAKASTNTADLENKSDIKGENPELVAVIMAAIAASEGSDFKNNLVIRKINRIAGNPPVWAKAGGIDCIESRKF
ncbi:OadG family protein [Anaerovorax odorimutans]|uniref:OadG family protein n=1 Tax=Anaerovorax odorimutans TaxID=109327 RepID=UPI00041EE1AB|nr:OadG family protein [Anaerovorax odorimutans]